MGKTRSGSALETRPIETSTAIREGVPFEGTVGFSDASTPRDLPPLDMAALLAMIPVPNAAVRPRRHGKTLILYVPIRRTWWMSALGWVPGVHFRQEKGVALDALGEEVWQACDGQRTAEQIIGAFAERHKLRFHDARLSVMAFMRILLQRNLIALVAKRD